MRAFQKPVQNQQPLSYYDIGNQPPTAHLFQHAKTTHQHVSPIMDEVLQAELERDRDRAQSPSVHTPSAPIKPRSPADGDHPDHKMLEHIREGVRQADQQAGKGWDDASERLSRCALAACKDDRERYAGRGDGTYSLSGNALNRVDHALLSKDGRSLFLVEGSLSD